MRIFKNKLSTFEWQLLNYLKDNCVSLENAVNGRSLQREFGCSSYKIRHALQSIKKHSNYVIGTHTTKGYYIATESEEHQATRLLVNRIKSELGSLANMDKKALNEVYKHLNELVKSVEYTQHKQFKMQLTGHERELHKRFGSDVSVME